MVRGAGSITFVELADKFYGICADDGARYDPGRLDAAFQQEGLRVHFEARVREGVMSARMWGIAVTLVSIEAMEGA